jgi:ABC-2 type transport system permease protein
VTALPQTTARPAAVPLPSSTRGGMPYWFASLRHMLRFDYGRMRQWAPMMAVIQMLMGAGMAIMYGFFYPHVTDTVALYIATGAPTLALIPLGFVMLPSAVSQQRLEGTFDVIWSLPAPRTAQATSTFLLYTLLSLPGMVLALLLAVWRYGIDLQINPLLVPAVLLCALMAVSVGFGMALAIPNPLVVNLISNMGAWTVAGFATTGWIIGRRR